MTEARAQGRVAEVLAAFFRVGCTSFGGPIADLGCFRAEFVARRRWLEQSEYADIAALIETGAARG